MTVFFTFFTEHHVIIEWICSTMCNPFRAKISPYAFFMFTETISSRWSPPCSPFHGRKHTFTGEKHAFFFAFTSYTAQQRMRKKSYLLQFSFNIRVATTLFVFLLFHVHHVCWCFFSCRLKHLIKQAFSDSLIVFSLHFLLSFLSLAGRFLCV